MSGDPLEEWREFMEFIHNQGKQVFRENTPRWDAGRRSQDPAEMYPNLAAEYEVWLMRIRADPKAVMWVPDALWTNEKFLHEAVAANVCVLEHIDSRAEVREDTYPPKASGWNRVLITRYGLDYGRGVLTDDRKFMLEAIKLHGSVAFRY